MFLDPYAPKALQEKVVYNYVECGKPGHVSWQCIFEAHPPKPPTWSTHNNTNYVVYKTREGRPMVKFFGPQNKNSPKMIWVQNIIVEKVFTSSIETA